MIKKYLITRGKSFKYAWLGIIHLFSNEANAKIHLLACILVIAASVIFNLTATEWCLVITAIGGVFMAEGFNTSIEKLCDKVSPEKNELIKTAKDVAAGAVLLFVIAAVVIGLIIFIPKIFAFFN